MMALQVTRGGLDADALPRPRRRRCGDPLLPIGVGELPADLREIDALLGDPALVLPIAAHWQREAEVRGYSTAAIGRPTIPMQTYVRLMVLKQCSRWGYETLVREVSDSIHLRRFCLIALGERLPDESTIRKLTRRLGAQTVTELCRAVIVAAASERRFRPRAVRIDSTVVEADVRYPTDAGLAGDGVGLLAREAGRLKERLERGGRGCGLRFATARAPPATGCGRSRARSPAAAGNARPRCFG